MAVDKGVDFAQYFCTYAYLYHQKEMLCDRVRMDSYYNSIFQNKHHFEGKVWNQNNLSPSGTLKIRFLLTLYKWFYVMCEEKLKIILLSLVLYLCDTHFLESKFQNGV